MVNPYDETDINDNDIIIRRVSVKHHIVPDENTGSSRISSKLYRPYSGQNGGMSVDILKLIEGAGILAREFVATPVFTGSVQFTGEQIRSVGLIIGYDPIPDNTFHGEVWLIPPGKGRFSKPQERALIAASEWFVEIEGVNLR